MVRLGVAAARWGYALIALICYGWVSTLIALGELPWAAALSLLPALASLAAMKTLKQHAGNPSALAPAIKATILAAVSHGLLLAVALVGSNWRP